MVPHIRFVVPDLCQMCRPAPFAQNGGSGQAIKPGAGNHQLLCRQAGEGQPRALPHEPRRRGGRASSTDRGRASSRQERCLSLMLSDGSVDLEFRPHTSVTLHRSGTFRCYRTRVERRTDLESPSFDARPPFAP
eukprot:scaffold71550_cov33-Phaeocystis_antarctica.AAC.1